MVVKIAALLSLIPASLATLYYYALAMPAIFRPCGRPVTVYGDARNFFAILIPAHNEEYTIAGAVASSLQLHYPGDCYRIYVIADNCTDRTAEVARACGVVVFERSDNLRRGKGFAIEWALKQIRDEPFDAVLMQDADSVLDRSALQVFNHYLNQGDLVLQAAYVVSNPEESAISYTAAVGNIIENDLFYAPKSRLNLSVFLRGTGMVLHRSVLERNPWNAYSIAEDTEYSIGLVRNGIPIRFLDDVSVYSSFPATAEQLHVQRLRWASGNLGFGKSHAWTLMVQGLHRRNWQLLDAGWTLLVVSRPLTFLAILVAVLFTGIAEWLQPDLSNAIMFGLALFGLVALMAYFLLGILRLGLNRRRLRLLAETPLVVIRLVSISLLGVMGVKRDLWARTPRA